MRRAAPLAMLVLPLAVAPAAAQDALAVDVAAVSSAAAPNIAKADGHALKGDTSRTRFLIAIERSVAFQVMSLSNPNRVVVELPDVRMQLPADPGSQPIGLVQSFRAGQSALGKSRIVIDVTQPVIVESSRIEPSADGASQVLALEIVPVDAANKTARKPLKTAPFALGATGLQPPLPQRAVRPDVRAQNSYKPIIVIDPGHGGDDTGAVKHGTVEKEVVLAFAKTLRAKLEATGRYKVLMTRDKDVFVPLDERRDYAERNKAALFIAVHADYASTKARGATIYSLRENVAKSLKRSAKGDVTENVLSSSEISTLKKVNGGDSDVSTVRNILADLAQREVDVTQERTSIFSRSVIEYMGETTNMRDDPDQQAAFRVLKTAQFPSVLIELAYVTNREDAAQLKSGTWRDKVSDSIATAVENYFSHQIARLPM
jgi:N-acetylmuramoyl-L-alanine amidase